ncbi:hypothetical protein D3C80_2014450 [compost metagenome]
MQVGAHQCHAAFDGRCLLTNGRGGLLKQIGQQLQQGCFLSGRCVSAGEVDDRTVQRRLMQHPLCKGRATVPRAEIVLTHDGLQRADVQVQADVLDPLRAEL